jgi:hypothetical protein
MLKRTSTLAEALDCIETNPVKAVIVDIGKEKEQTLVTLLCGAEGDRLNVGIEVLQQLHHLGKLPEHITQFVAKYGLLTLVFIGMSSMAMAL